MFNKILVAAIIVFLIFVFKPWDYFQPDARESTRITGEISKDPAMVGVATEEAESNQPENEPTPTPTAEVIPIPPTPTQIKILRPLTNDEIKQYCIEICGRRGFMAYANKLEYRYFECDCRDRFKYYIDFDTMEELSTSEVFQRDGRWTNGKKK